MTDHRPPPRPSRRSASSARAPAAGLPWRQRVLHALLVAAGWCLFVWFWSLAIGQPYEARELRLLIAGCLVVVPAITLGWVLHNVGIYRRKGPRKRVPDASASYRVDFNGRRIVADWRMLDRVRHAEIGVASDLKFYRFARAVEEGRASAAAAASAQAPARVSRPAELSE